MITTYVDDDGSSLSWDSLWNVSATNTDGSLYVPAPSNGAGVVGNLGATLDYGIRRAIDSVFGPTPSQQVRAQSAAGTKIDMGKVIGIAAVVGGLFLAMKAMR